MILFDILIFLFIGPLCWGSFFAMADYIGTLIMFLKYSSKKGGLWVQYVLGTETRCRSETANDISIFLNK